MSVQWKELSANEIAERSQTLAETIEVLKTVQGDKKSAMAEFKKQIDSLEKEISRLADVVRTGKEMFEVTLFDDVEVETYG